MNLVASGYPLHLLDSGKYQNVLYLPTFESALDSALAKNFLIFRDSV